jgi:hypothetical protein
MPTMLHGPVGKSDVYLAVHGRREPTAREWDEFIAAWTVHGEAVRAAGRQPLSLNVTSGGAPNAAQRKAMDATNKPLRPKVAVLNDSALVRGAITALSWLGGAEVRAFKLGDYDGACAFLGSSATIRDQARAQAASAMQELLASVGPDPGAAPR